MKHGKKGTQAKLIESFGRTAYYVCGLYRVEYEVFLQILMLVTIINPQSAFMVELNF